MDAFINAIDVKVPGASCTGGTPVDEVHISRPYRRKTRQHDASRCGADASDDTTAWLVIVPLVFTLMRAR